MHGLQLAGVIINRKMLADLAVREKANFAALVELAKKLTCDILPHFAMFFYWQSKLLAYSAFFLRITFNNFFIIYKINFPVQVNISI